jgi:hypothetical protein
MGVVIKEDRAMTVWEKAFSLLAWMLIGIWMAWLVWSENTAVEARFHKLMELPVNKALLWDHPALFFGDGWSFREATHRWTAGHSARLYFRLGKKPNSSSNISLILETIHVIDQQPVTMHINGHMVATFKFSHLSKIAEVAVSDGVLEWNAMNKFSIALPKARAPSGNDNRLLGIALKSFILKLSPI